jgi:hypothetical protein
VSIYNIFNYTFVVILVFSSQSKSHKRLAPVGSHVQGHSDTDSDIDVDMASTEIIGDKPDLRDMVTDCDNDDERYISYRALCNVVNRYSTIAPQL